MASGMQFFDGVALAAVVAELNALGEARIDKVGQPSANELYLLLRAGGRNHRLYVNLRDQWARLHLTTRQLGNMAVPTGFTMQLRKHLEGSRLLRVEQDGLERVGRLVVAGRDELGDPYERILVIELIGKFANMFLVDAKDEAVMGCLRPITEAMSSVRQVGPGLPYDPPPKPENKVPFLEAAEADVLRALERPGRLADSLVATLAGLSKLAAQQLLAEAGIAPGIGTEALDGLDPVLAAVRQAQASLRAGLFFPRLLAATPGATAPPPAHHPLAPGDYTLWWLADVSPPTTPGVSALLDAYYGQLEDSARLEALRGRLQVEIGDRQRKQHERLTGWRDTLRQAETADRQRELGDLLTAHMYLLKPGMAEVEVEDYFAAAQATDATDGADATGINPSSRVVIPLDSQLSPSENVQRYFKRYQKARNSQRAVSALLETGEREAAYLAQVAIAIDQAPSLTDLAEIAQELAEGGGKASAGGKPQQAGKKGLLAGPGKGQRGPGRSAPRGKTAEPPPAPLRLLSSDGLPILVGKNNRQNEFVTFKEAHAGDWWLHTQIIPGSHVVIRHDGDVPERTLHEAATLAAHFSQARESSRVPVVYTRRRHVRKPNGAKPGMVLYEQEKTLFVTPDPAVVQRLLTPEAAVPTSSRST